MKKNASYMWARTIYHKLNLHLRGFHDQYSKTSQIIMKKAAELHRVSNPMAQIN
jgi:hypothetical protein